MRLVAVLEAVVVNAVLIALLALVTMNYGLRTAYWGTEGFAPTTVRYPFFLITHAVNGSTYIPGILSVDWQQVLLVVLVAADALFAWSALRPRQVDGPS